MEQLRHAYFTLVACLAVQGSISAQEIVALDRLGRTYTSDQIDGNNTQNFLLLGGGGGCPTPCAAGIFELHFAAGSGFDDPVDGPARQEVARQVFQDYSQLLVPADDPCNGANLLPFVRVWFPAPGGIVPPGAAALGSSLYNYVTINNTAIPYDDFTPTSLQEGVIDGEVWRTINGGTDSWRSINYAIRRGAGNPPWLLFHGLVSVDFSAAPFYTGMTLPVPPGMADLYSVIAHEATHMLGFHTFTNQSGLGFLNSRYYSRYDLLLEQTGASWITDPLLCSGWASNTDPAFDLEPGGCITMVSGTYTTTPQPVYAPMPWNGSSLSHLDGICGSLPYLMNHDNLNPLGMSRVPLQGEVNILCDIDYHTSTHHGTTGTGWDDTYHVRSTCGQRLAGVDDLVSDCVTKPFYTYKQGQATPLTIDDFLENDEDEANTSLGIIGTPQSYACMEVLLGGDNGMPPASSGGTSIDYAPDPGFVGWAVIRYRPVSVDGRLGSITYIFVEVWPPDVCGVEPCNILNGGTFEGLPLQSRTGAPHDSYQRTGASANSPDLFALDAILPPPNWLEMNGYNTMVGMCGPVAPIVPGAGVPPNERYMTMVASVPANPNNEGVLFELCRPLLDGIAYTLEYKARTGGCLRDLRFYAFQDRPCNPLQGLTSFTVAGPCNNGIVPVQFVPIQSVASAPWQVQSAAFTFAGSQRNWVVVVSAGPTSGALSVDDFAIRPAITADATILPSCIGQATGSIALDVHYYPGSYSILWSNGATTATISNVAAGTYTVTITDTEVGCASFTETYTVPDQPCADGFIIAKTVNTTFTYSGAPIVYTITVCNSTTVDQNVVLTDVLTNFVMTASNPIWTNFPTASLTLFILGGDCQTIQITGFFNTIGSYENCVTATPALEDPVSDCADIVQVAQNCPLMVSGIGECDETAEVNMCMSVHSLIADVLTVDFLWIYPDFLDAGDIADATSSLGSINTGLSSIGAPFAYTGIPPGASWGYEAVAVHVVFNSPISTSSGQLICVPFTFDLAIPTGYNVFLTMVQGSGGQHLTDLLNSLSQPIHPGGFYTQAANIILLGCPDLPFTPDAGFAVEVPPCGGGVHVEGVCTDANAIHMWTWGDDRTTPTNGAQQYDYDYFAAVPINQVPAYSVPPAAPGTYTITHTVILNGVASSSTQTITIYECCQAAVSIPDGSLASVVGTVFSGTVDIQGQFFVDDDVLFQNAQVYMEPGAEIVVQGGWTLDIDNSSFTACNGIMWKAITAEDGSTVRIRGSFMDDAESTIAALDGSVIWVDGTQFHNNRVAIGVPDLGLPYNNVACWVSNSTFYSAGPMPQPYSGQTSAVGDVGYAAVDVNETSLDFTGGNNIIHSLSNGIVGHRSDMSVSGCTMLNIQPNAAYASTGNGSGIYAKGDRGFFYLKQVGFGTTGLASFTDCRWGVYTEYMNVRSTDNNMVNVGTAYRVDKSGYMHVDLLNNTLDTRYDGIDLRFNDGAAHLLVENNEITFATNPPPGQYTKGYVAIRSEEANTLNPESIIRNNLIHYRSGVTTAHTGIRLTACNAYLVAGNDLRMRDNATNYNGVFLRGCERCEVSCNSVLGWTNGYPEPGQSSIRNTMGADPLISCNTVDRTSNGIIFSGWAYGTDVRGNNLWNHQWPLHLDNSAIIDVQVLKGNLWHAPVPGGGIGAWYENTFNAAVFQFLYNPAIIGGGNTQPPSWTPSNWFYTDPGLNYQCDDGSMNYCSELLDERCKGCPRPIDEKIAEDSLMNGSYTDETKWIMAGDLYKKLDENLSLLSSDPLLADFYAEQQGTLIAQFKELDDAQWQLYDLDSLVFATLQENQQQIADLMGLVKNAMEQLGDSTLTTVQRQLLLSTIGGHQQTIRNLSNYNATALQLAADSRVLAANNVKATNATLGTSEMIEANQKQVNDIYLGTVAKDFESFTTAQATQLFDIANQCPMVGGNAVFRARALYSLIDDEAEFDDPLLCLQQGIIVKSMEVADVSSVGVVPNPATDEASLVLIEEWDAPGVFIVYDALGAEVFRHVIPAHTLRFAFSTASLAPAIFHYRVRSPSGVESNGKLSIVR
jgi:hypothetical protein